MIGHDEGLTTSSGFTRWLRNHYPDLEGAGHVPAGLADDVVAHATEKWGRWDEKMGFLFFEYTQGIR